MNTKGAGVGGYVKPGGSQRLSGLTHSSMLGEGEVLLVARVLSSNLRRMGGVARVLSCQRS